jgi:small subunit ribosomal protein S21
MSVRIVLADKEPIGLALRRFKRQVERSRLTHEVRCHETFLKPNQHRRSKAYKKRIKARLATLIAQIRGEQPVVSLDEACKAFEKKRGKP